MAFDKFGERLDIDPRNPEYAPPRPVHPEAIELIGLIAAEFRSDPMSVQCFDKRIVERCDICRAPAGALQIS